jgi:hypothetical protein
VFSCALLFALLIKPKEVSSQFSLKSRYLPFITGSGLLLILFFQSNFASYKKNFTDPPDSAEKFTLEYILW